MIKNEVLQLNIESYGAFGEGVAHVDGYAVFIPYALVGERVEALILSVKKGYAYAKVLNVIERSKDRRSAPCEYFTRCGGCDLQHLNYSAQLKLKKDSVQKTLHNVGGIDFEVDEVYPSIKEFDTRNKLTLPFSMDKSGVVLGFYSERSHRVVGIPECALSAWSKKLIKCVTDWANKYSLSVYDERNKKGILRALTARVAGDKTMVTLVVVRESVPHLDKLSEDLSKLYENGIFYLNINEEDTNVVLGNRCVKIFGEDKLVSRALGVRYELSPLSFAQVNDYVRDALYSKVVSEIKEDDIVIDAYSGAGLMSVLCAKVAKKVYGVEIIPDAVYDADDTARKNVVQDKVVNQVGDCARVLPELCKKLRLEYARERFTIILDPPRKGCDERVLEAVLECKPDKIIYVSCNPATLARDLKTLTTKYSINYVKPFDMFPQTKHVETIVCLTRNK